MTCITQPYDVKALLGPYRCILSRRLRRKWFRVHIGEIAVVIALSFGAWVTLASAALILKSAFLLAPL